MPRVVHRARSTSVLLLSHWGQRQARRNRSQSICQTLALGLLEPPCYIGVVVHNWTMHSPIPMQPATLEPSPLRRGNSQLQVSMSPVSAPPTPVAAVLTQPTTSAPPPHVLDEGCVEPAVLCTKPSECNVPVLLAVRHIPRIHSTGGMHGSAWQGQASGEVPTGCLHRPEHLPVRRVHDYWHAVAINSRCLGWEAAHSSS